ncbi:MAG: oligosaccharide flippase family protein [Anaerolineaceae bacterium]
MFKPKNLALAGGINLFFLIFNSVFFLILTPLTLNNMGTADYGIWMILLAFSQLAGLATFGAGSAVEKFIAQSSDENQSKEFSACITFSYAFLTIIGALMVLAVWLLRFWIAELIQTGGAHSFIEIANAVGLMAFSLLPQFLTQISKGIFLGLVKNFWAGFFDSLQTTGLWLGVYILTIFSTDFSKLAWWVLGLSWFSFIFTILVLWKTFRSHRYHPLIIPKMTKAMLHQSLLIWFSSLGIALFQNVDRIIVGYFIGPAAAGVYSLATSVALRITILLGQFTQVLTPLASRWHADGFDDQIVKVYSKVLRFSAWFLFFVSGLLVIWMPIILNLWISPDFSETNGIYFQILIVIYSLFSLARPAQQILNGIGQVEMPALVFFISGVATLVVIAFGARKFGLIGAVVGNATYCGIVVLNFSLSKYFHLPFWEWIKEVILPSFLVVMLLASSILLPKNFLFYVLSTIALGVLFVPIFSKKKPAILDFRHLYSPDG